MVSLRVYNIQTMSTNSTPHQLVTNFMRYMLLVGITQPNRWGVFSVHISKNAAGHTAALRLHHMLRTVIGHFEYSLDQPRPTLPPSIPCFHHTPPPRPPQLTPSTCTPNYQDQDSRGG